MDPAATRRVTILLVVGCAAIAILLLVVQQSQAPMVSDVSNSFKATPAITGVRSPNSSENKETLAKLPRFDRSKSYESFDFQTLLKDSLVEGRLGVAPAQYRASILLRDCRGMAMVNTPEELQDKGVSREHIELIQSRNERCKDVLSSQPLEANVLSGRLRAAALQQNYPIAVAEQLVLSSHALLPETIDAKLREAILSAGDDRILRYQAYFVVLSAMNKRASATGMEADPVVVNAWTLLHCRESWECDLDATLKHLALEMQASSLQITIDLAEEIEDAIATGDMSTVRLY